MIHVHEGNFCPFYEVAVDRRERQLAANRTSRDCLGTTTFGGWVQSMNATLYLFTIRWIVSNGLPDMDQVRGGTEGGHPGSLAAR
jgi:hypothetical protein